MSVGRLKLDVPPRHIQQRAGSERILRNRKTSTHLIRGSVALKNTIRRRLNTASNKGTNGPKRAQAFGIKGPKLPNDQIQVSGIKGDHSDHVYFVNLFPRMKLNHSTA